MIKTYLFTKQGVQEDVPLDDWRNLVKDDCAILWVDVRGMKEGELSELAPKFGLHDLALDSCRDPYRRPHLYDFKDHFYINLTVVKPNRSHDLRPAELHLFAGEKFIITATKEEKSEAVDKALAEFNDEPDLCSRGTIYAVYLLSEELVETYYPIVEKLDDDADGLESDMFDIADKSSLKRVFHLKRQTFELRKLLGPQRDILNELSRRDFPFIEGESQVYFQDVYNRMIRIFDMLDTIREILSGSLDIYLSSVSNRLNEVMKVLTIAATILVTLSVITGYYGMNVALPGQHNPYAWVGIFASMAITTVALFWWFRRKKWM